jgi:LAO/AO transport system kinase
MDIERLSSDLRNGDRRALGKAITLVESHLPRDRARARELLAHLPQTPLTLRLGITGAPGVGKSTFIDALGALALAEGWRPAVLAYDPSGRHGGSLLGDKTRMLELSQSEQAFVRPSPNRGVSGGIGQGALGAIRLCEAAGYDPIIVETVGAGQSELAVIELTDVLLVLIQPGAGDELQAIKKGILEHSDFILIGKADGDQKLKAETFARDYTQAMSLVGPLRRAPLPKVMAVSAVSGCGIRELWQGLRVRFVEEAASGALEQRRLAKLGVSFRRAVVRELERRVLERPEVEALRADLERRLILGELKLDIAVDELVSAALARQAGPALAD